VSSQKPKRRRLRRWLVGIGLGLVLVIGTGIVVLRVKFHGAALAGEIEGLLNKRMRGRVEIGSIDWGMTSLPTIATGGWVPITMKNVTVWDRRTDERTRDCFTEASPPPPQRVLETPLITAELDIHALMFGDHDLVFRNVVVTGGNVRLQQISEPYPLHAYDRTIVSLIAAFYPCMRAGFRAGFYAAVPPPRFDVRNVDVKDVDVELLIGPDDDVPWDAPTGPFYNATVSVRDVFIDDAFLYMDPKDPLVSRLYFSVAARGGQTTVRLFDQGVKDGKHDPEYTIELEHLNIERLAQLPEDWLQGARSGVANSLRLKGVARTTEGADIDIHGDLIDWWDRQYDGTWDIHLIAKNMGPTLKRRILTGLSGADVTTRLDMTGPFIALPKIDFELEGLDYDVQFDDPETPKLGFTLDTMTGWVDFVNENGKLDQTVARVRGGKDAGEITLAASFGLPMNVNATLDITKPIDLGPWLPPRVRGAFGQWLSGHLRAGGKSETRLGLTEVDLWLGRNRHEKLTRLHGGEVLTEKDFETIEVAAKPPMKLDAGRTSVTIEGGLNLANQDLLFFVRGRSNDLDVWLRRFGAPRIATSAENMRLEIRGSIVDGETQYALAASGDLRGVPTIDQVHVVARVEDERLFIDSLDSSGMGGTLTGAGTVRLGGAPYVERLELEGHGLDVGKIPGAGAGASGTIRSAKINVRGPLGGKRDAFDWLAITTGYAVSDQLVLMGDRYRDAAICINYPDDELCRRPGAPIDPSDLTACDAAKKGGTCVVGRAQRADGGSVDVTLATPARKRRDTPPVVGTIAVTELPLAVIAEMLDVRPSPVGGIASSTLRIGGTRTSPTADGAIALLETWVLGAFIGDSQLDVKPATDDPRYVTITGRTLHGRLGVEARLGTFAPFPIEMTLTGRRIELDTIVDVQRVLDIDEPLRGWATGKVTVSAELTGKTEPMAWIELDELVAIVDHRDPDGRMVPLRVTALPASGRPAVSMRASPSSVALVCRQSTPDGPAEASCPVRLATPAGVLEVSGEARPEKLALSANGTLDLALIGPLLDRYFDEVSGTVEVKAALAGTFAKPMPEMDILLKDIRIRPTGQDTVVRVAPPNRLGPQPGLIKVANNSLGFTNVRIRVDDTYLGEETEMAVKGSIGLDGITPSSWGLIVDGQIAGKMLLALAPQYVSQASGVATIEELTFSGEGKQPVIRAELGFEPGQPFAIVPRGLRRELALSDGTITVSDAGGKGDHRAYLIRFEDVAGSIDGEGTLADINGSIELIDGAPTYVDVTVDADAIPFRVPRTLDLVVNADDLRLRKYRDGDIDVTGTIELISGRYIRKFDLGQVIRPTASAAPSTPFWEEYPSLGAARLRLDVDIRQFSVDNNLAQIDLTGRRLSIGGTPRDPRIGGDVKVQNGRFRLPGTRVSFTRSSGEIRFVKQQAFPSQTPELQIKSEADYRDPSGQDHLITLHITGTLPELQWDLYTSTGFDKAQTTSLIFLGRTSDQFRTSLGDDAAGGDPTRVDPSTNPGASPLDQVLKDATSDWISLLVEDSLKQVSRLDVARVFVGAGSWGFHGEKKVLENLNVIGDYEQTSRGRTINVRGELKTPWRFATGRPLSLQAQYLDKSFEDIAEEDVSDGQLKLVYRFFIP
jgi:hypothetical protein